MKIHIRAEGHTFWIVLPTRLLLSKSVVKLGLRLARKNASETGKGNAMLSLSDEKILRICTQIKQEDKTMTFRENRRSCAFARRSSASSDVRAVGCS